MIETDYYTIPTNIFSQIKAEAEELQVSVDYYLMEFCSVSEEK